MTLNAHDIKTAREAWDELVADADDYDGPEIVCLSVGYCNVYLDGDVTFGPTVLGNVCDHG